MGETPPLGSPWASQAWALDHKVEFKIVIPSPRPEFVAGILKGKGFP